MHYWKNDYESEVDFIVQSDRGLIIPIEVKSSNNVKSRSLHNYISEFQPKYSIRISTRNFGFKDGIKSIPLYATFCINKKSLDNMQVKL